MQGWERLTETAAVLVAGYSRLLALAEAGLVSPIRATGLNMTSQGSPAEETRPTGPTGRSVLWSSPKPGISRNGLPFLPPGREFTFVTVHEWPERDLAFAPERGYNSTQRL